MEKKVKRLDGIYHPRKRLYIGKDGTVTYTWTKPDLKLTQQNWWGDGDKNR